MRKLRKNYTPAEKVTILRRHLIDRVPVLDLCDEHKLSPTLFYLWHEQFFENGAAALERKNASPEAGLLRTIAALREKLQRNNIASWRPLGKGDRRPGRRGEPWRRLTTAGHCPRASGALRLILSWAEDRVPWRHDPSADSGTNTEGGRHDGPVFPFEIGTKAVNRPPLAPVHYALLPNPGFSISR
jgi:transposase